jgi:DnaK suppressor protein
MKFLTPDQTSELRAMLMLREQQLAAEISAGLTHRQHDDDREADTTIVDLEASLGLAEVLRDQAEQQAIHAALGRIDRGTYGRCLSCGAHIPIERLHAQPAAALCHVCQSRAEEHHTPGFSAP